MQTTSAQFSSRAKGDMRPLSWQTRMSFDKVFDPSVAFFTLNTSVLNGPDILASADSDVVTEWDKYTYVDYSNRVISMEWSRQEDIPSSVNLAIADVVLDNHDDYFTPNGGSSIENFILPYRPIRLFAGFAHEDLPVFVGLTEKMPAIDTRSKTVSFHCTDFLSSLLNRPLDETVMYQDYFTHEVLDALFQLFGLSPSQYILDQSLNSIAFVYFEKGTKLGSAVDKLMEAEVGRLYMDELGIIRFKNRANFSDTPVYFFDKSNTIECEISTQDDIINVVEVKSNVLQAQELQPVWQVSQSKPIPGNSSINVWADFSDPVTSCNDPINGLIDNNSYFVANDSDNPDSTLVSSGVTVTSSTVFARSYLATIENANAFTVFITSMELWGTPAKVVDNIYIREQDDDSVEKYDERVYSIQNDLIQSISQAQTLALIVIQDFKEYGGILSLTVKGTPALQMGDAVTVSIGSISGVYVITKLVNKYVDASFIQQLTVKRRQLLSYFVLDQSVLDGSDVLSP